MYSIGYNLKNSTVIYNTKALFCIVQYSTVQHIQTTFLGTPLHCLFPSLSHCVIFRNVWK